MLLLGHGLKLVGENSEASIGVVLDSTLQKTESNEGTGLDVVVLTLNVLIDELEAVVHVPNLKQANGGSGRNLTLILVLEDPVTILGLLRSVADVRIVAKTGIDESIAIRLGQVLLR